IANCPGGRVLVEGSTQFPSRLKITQLGSGAGSSTTMVLAGGAKYTNEAAAAAASARQGQLGETNVEANLTGKGAPSAVVGSTDGYLYSVNPCTSALDFALDFGAGVSEAVFGDTDGDGRDEILVSVADGYLYNVRNKSIPATDFVWDTDPAHGITDQDV